MPAQWQEEVMQIEKKLQKTEGNLIEKRRAVIFEVTDKSQLNKKLDVADDLSRDESSRMTPRLCRSSTATL